MKSRSILAIILTALVVGICLAVALTAPTIGAEPANEPACGLERWHIKTLADADAPYVHMNPVTSSVPELRALSAPSDFSVKNDTRRYDPVERQAYRVHALLVGWKQETDSDFHIVIADPNAPAHTMVVEVPDPSCQTSQASGYAPRYARVRNAFVTCFGLVPRRFTKFAGHMIAELDGIGFFDVDHGQTGRAKLGSAKVDIELHPLLRVKTLSGTCPKHAIPSSAQL